MMISCQDIKLHLEFTLHIHVIHRGSGGILPQALYQWHSQDIEVAWAQGFDAAEGSTWSCAAWGKIFTIISQLPGWALVALSCFALQAILA